MRAYFKKALPDTYYPAADDSLTDEQRVWLSHQGLAVAHQYATKLGLDPFEIPTLVCIRNPYSLTLSGYKYLFQRWKDRIDDIESTFTEYLENLLAKTPAEQLEKRANYPYGPFSGFMMLGDSVPSNLTIARTESLSEDVAGFVEKHSGVRPSFEFPHRNKSEHVHFSAYYTGKEEELVYRMYKNTFESGLYKRYEGLDQGRLA